MDLERQQAQWTRIKESFCAWQDLDESDRGRFLEELAHSDPELRFEVDRLVKTYAESEFLEGGSPEPSCVGQRLSHYEILEETGRGGMGLVYKARDVRLNRIVALKILRWNASDRLLLEARAISALNHPHICTLFDVGEVGGIAYLVMEYVEGRVPQGSYPATVVLDYGIQLASALSSAHALGIIHRDLKPSNVLLTESGVKLLDFGLAGNGDFAATSGAGFTAGTPAYMSPEQLAGGELDGRSDIYSLGLILREMLAGKRTGSLDEPVRSLAIELPEIAQHLAAIVDRCIASEPESRWPTAAKLEEELRREQARLSESGRTWRRVQLMAAAATVFVLLGIWLFKSQRPERSYTLEIAPPSGRQFAFGEQGGGLAVSPDGAALAYVTIPGQSLHIKRFTEENSIEVPGGGGQPFWSPDSRELGFFRQFSLMAYNLKTGKIRTVTELPNYGWQATWGSRNEIVYGYNFGLYRVAASGGQGRSLLLPSHDPLRETITCPLFMPDGEHLIYRHAWPREQGKLELISLEDPSHPVELVDASWMAAYMPPWDGRPSQLLWVNDGVLWAQMFESKTGILSGRKIEVAGGIGTAIANSTWADYSASDNGILVYRRRGPRTYELTWRETGGKEFHPGVSGELYAPSVSPDSRAVAFDSRFVGEELSSIRIVSFADPKPRQLTTDSLKELTPIWSPDGKEIAYVNERSFDDADIRVAPVDGSSPSRVLARMGDKLTLAGWSPDGRYLTFVRYAVAQDTGWDVWILPIGGTPSLLIQTKLNDSAGRISPDGRWIAFTRETDHVYLYVARFYGDGLHPRAGRKVWRVSATPGSNPQWSKDGRAIYFVTNEPMSIAKAPVNLSGEEFTAGETTEAMGSLPRMNHGYRMSIAPDGRRVAFLSNLEAPTEPRITVITNWQPRPSDGKATAASH